MLPPDPTRIKTLNGTIDALRAAPRHRVKDFKQDPIYSQNTHQGIYVITDPTDESVVYVGKTNSGTKEKGVADRIHGHSARGSDLQIALGISPKDFDDYNVRTIQINNPDERGLAELYGIAVYAPKGNRYGYRGISTDLDERTPTA